MTSNVRYREADTTGIVASLLMGAYGLSGNFSPLHIWVNSSE